MKKIFLILCVLGVILPYYHLYFFLTDNDWSMNGFWSEIYSNHAISMITMDITVAASSYLIFLIYQIVNNKITKYSFIKYFLSLFLVGFSLSYNIKLDSFKYSKSDSDDINKLVINRNNRYKQFEQHCFKNSSYAWQIVDRVTIYNSNRC